MSGTQTLQDTVGDAVITTHRDDMTGKWTTAIVGGDNDGWLFTYREEEYSPTEWHAKAKQYAQDAIDYVARERAAGTMP